VCVRIFIKLILKNCQNDVIINKTKNHNNNNNSD